MGLLKKSPVGAVLNLPPPGASTGSLRTSSALSSSALLCWECWARRTGLLCSDHSTSAVPSASLVAVAEGWGWVMAAQRGPLLTVVAPRVPRWPLWHPESFSTWPWTNLSSQDLKEGTAGRVPQHPTDSIEGRDGHRVTTAHRNTGRLLNPATTKHGVLPRWQSPYSILKTDFKYPNTKA